jgi:thiol:disulfide interchange protein DsbD
MLRFKAKNLFLLSFFLFFAGSLLAQIENPVTWEVSLEELEGNKVEVVAKASVEEGWHIYGLEATPDPDDMGPLPTQFVFEESNDYDIIAKPTSSEFVTEYDPIFEIDVNYFDGDATFRQVVDLQTTDGVQVEGHIEGMVCNEEKCIMLDPYRFSLAANGGQQTKEEQGIQEPVKWQISSAKTGEEEYTITVQASIDEGWHLYSQTLPSDQGPVPTELLLDTLEGMEFIGGFSEPEPHLEYDPNFMMDLSFFEGEVAFRQKVKVPEGTNKIEGSVYYMVCNDKMCLPPTLEEFYVNLNTGSGGLAQEEFDNAPTGPASFEYLRSALDLKDPVVEAGECSGVTKTTDTDENTSLLNLFILGFLGGLVALLTPCVFPMIPLTVSFFTKGSGSRRKGLLRAGTYGLFIFLIYLILSIPFHLLDQIDENILNTISTDPILNVIFFTIFIVFAISFFGYFEITIPSKFANRADSASNTGGLVGTFFMALTLAIVSFSCTGPILGSLLAGSLTSSGGAMQLTAGMGGFGFALGIPFAIFAAFPGMLNSLPKSGGWLNTVKVVLGFAELALALKFLSNADLVEHWGILKIEVFLGLWIIIFALMGLYIFGVIKFPHDSPLKKLSFSRISFGILIFAFVAYLASGFRYNDKTESFTTLGMLSGLAPPVGYSWVYPKDCPLMLDCEKDYMMALERAKRENKPIMVDFTGYACVNCRKMEENVWDKPGVYDMLKDEYIVVSLYVDDRKELPEAMKDTIKMERTGNTKIIETYGDKWSAFEIETFNSNSQPFYALISPDEVLLNKPVGYTPDVDEYRAWLRCGINAFETVKED